MKHILLFFFLCFFIFNTKAQSFKETLDWIKIAIESNSHCFITISNDSSTLIVIDEPSGDNRIGVRQTILFKNIRTAKFEQDSIHLRLNIKCTSNRCVHADFKLPDDSEFKFPQDVVVMSINFNYNSDEKMRDRVIKAFNHLILLSVLNRVS